MVGLVPTIHVFASISEGGVQDVDARHKGEHDGSGYAPTSLSRVPHGSVLSKPRATVVGA